MKAILHLLSVASVVIAGCRQQVVYVPVYQTQPAMQPQVQNAPVVVSQPTQLPVTRYSSSNCPGPSNRIERLQVTNRLPDGSVQTNALAFVTQNCNFVLVNPSLEGTIEVQAADVSIESGRITGGQIRAMTGSRVRIRNSVIDAMLVTDTPGTFVDEGGNTFYTRDHQTTAPMRECSPGVVCKATPQH